MSRSFRDPEPPVPWWTWTSDGCVSIRDLRRGPLGGLVLAALTHVLKYPDSERMAQCHQIAGEYTAECQHRLTVQ